MNEKPKISLRDYEILKWHCAGRKHSWIARKYKVSRKYIDELIRKTAGGFDIICK